MHRGPSLLEHLDTMPMVDRKVNSPLMVPDGEPCSEADGPGALKEGDAVAADGDGSWF